MCCFSIPTPKSFWQRWFAPKIHVSATNIFARAVAPGVQALVYSMNLATSAEIAMILPIPVRPGTGDNALRFVDLQKHPQMFAELEALFEFEQPGQPKGGMWRDARPTLTVHEVGSFIATYVPSKVDFDRVDRRFWLPRVVLDSVPAYADYGFAVFQLKPGSAGPTRSRPRRSMTRGTIHPMAFTFPSRELERLYFPTVHLHDGRFSAEAEFDHSLYYQHPRVREAGGTVTRDTVTSVMATKDYEGLVDTTRPLIKRTVRGTHPNADIWIETARPPSVPEL